MNKNRLLQRWHIGCTLLAALFMASCSQEELDGTQGEPLPAGKYPLELTASGLEVVATPAQASTRGTFEGNWDGVQSVNVRVNRMVKEYKVTPSDYKTASLTPAESLINTDTDFWWNRTGETKNVMAWSPTSIEYDREFTLPEEWTENTLAEYDIIGATKPISYGDENKNLDFRHLLAKVVVNLRQSDYLKDAKEISVKLIDRSRTGMLKTNYNGELIVENMYTGYSDMTLCFLSDKSRYEEVMFGNVPGIPFASYTGLVIPTDHSSQSILQIEVDGITYTLTQKAIGNPFYVSYRAGEVTTFNITVNGPQSRGVTVEQSEWAD